MAQREIVEQLESRRLLAATAVPAAAQAVTATKAAAVTKTAAPTTTTKATTANTATAKSNAVSAVTSLQNNVLFTDADYARMKAGIAAGSGAIYNGWVALTKDGYASLIDGGGGSVAPRPVVTVVRGSSDTSNPDNYATLVIDIQRTYELALRWKMTGDVKYGDMAVKFLNTWATTNTSFASTGEAGLGAGLYGYDFAVAADIMKGYSGWSAADQTTFKNYLVNVYYPPQHTFLTNHNGAYITNYWANWDMACVQGMMAVGIFAGRTDLYNEAVNYLYSGAGEGSLDKIFYYRHAGNLVQYQESGRDQGHSVLGMQQFGHIAQMAWNQGTDLYSYDNNAYLGAMEYVAKYNLGYDVPYETYITQQGNPSLNWTTTVTQTTVGSTGRGDTDVGFMLGYAHYVQMLGMAAPYTTQRVNAIGTEGRGSGDDMGFGTLTDALPAVSTAGLTPSGLTAKEITGNVELDWFGTVNAISYNVYRAASGGAYTLVASGITDLLTYTDTGLAAGTYSYKVTAVTPTGETAASNVVTAASTYVPQTRLDFNEASGTTSADLTGNGNTATFVNGATFAAGKTGNAVSLDGTDDYVSLPADVVKNMTDFTISANVYLTSSTNWQRIFDFGESTGHYMYLTARNGSGKLQFTTTKNYATAEQSVVGSTLPRNQWVKVAVTLAGHTATLYVNGVQVGQNTAMDFPPSQIGSTPQNWIGRSQTSTDPYFKGKIDDFRIFRGALGAADVATLSAGVTPAAPTGLTATAAAGGVMLAWATVSGAAGYTVKRSTVSGGPYTTLATLAGTATTYADATAATGTTYYYVVSATNVVGEGSNSAQAQAAILPPATVSSFAVNDGSAQRSMVTSLTLGFSQAVALGGGAFTLARSGAAVTGVTVTVTAVSSTQYVLNFSGAGVTAGSLADGSYTLVVSGAAVTNTAGLGMAADASYGFSRLFGDADGDGDVDATDSRAFRGALDSVATSPAYKSYFDVDGDGDIDATDSRAFRGRLDTVLA